MFFKKKLLIYAPVDGDFMALKDVGDDVFSNGMMGNGFAVSPTSEIIVAPADAQVISAPLDMRHAIGLRLKNGCEMLIHVGLDTVKLMNQGFTFLVAQGEQIKQGQALLKFDNQIIQKAGLSNTVIVVLTDQKDLTLNYLVDIGKVNVTETVIMTLK